jgi:deoxycytidylate deaminase
MSQKKGTRKKYSLTATIYDKRGNILSTGTNSYTKTHPYQYHLAKQVGRKDAVFLHAEIQAIIRLKHNPNAHKIVIERTGNNGDPLPASPCDICKLAIKNAGIKVIVHS